MQEAENKMRSLRATIQHLRNKNPEKPIFIRLETEFGEEKEYPAEQIPTLGVILEELSDPDDFDYSVFVENKLMRKGTIIVREEEEKMPQAPVIHPDKAMEKMAASMSALMEKGMGQIIEATNSRIILMQEGFKQQIEAQNQYHKNLMDAQSRHFEQSMELALKRQELELKSGETDWLEVTERLTEIIPGIITDVVDVYSKVKAAQAGGTPT